MILDNIEFAKSQKIIEQTLDICQFKRAVDVLESLNGTLKFTLLGDTWQDKPALKVLIYGRISTLCQNCLTLVEVQLRHTGIVPIFNNESELDEALFGDNCGANDGIIASPKFDVLEFIEDEVIMLLPLSPKHQECFGSSYKDSGNNPFGMLRQLTN